MTETPHQNMHKYTSNLKIKPIILNKNHKIINFYLTQKKNSTNNQRVLNFLNNKIINAVKSCEFIKDSKI